MRGFDFSKYNRIILIGSPGSGKSWLAKRIADITGYKLYHLDKEFHLPNWQRPHRDIWVEKQEKMISGKKWIIDGHYNNTIELRYAAADLVIFLDINPFVCMWGAAKRQGKKRSDFPDYLTEPKVFSRLFLNFCKDIWTFPKWGRRTVKNLREQYPKKEFLHIRSRRQIKKLLKNNNK